MIIIAIGASGRAAGNLVGIYRDHTVPERPQKLLPKDRRKFRKQLLMGVS